MARRYITLVNRVFRDTPAAPVIVQEYKPKLPVVHFGSMSSSVMGDKPVDK